MASQDISASCGHSCLFHHKKQSHLSRQQISPGLVLCSDTGHCCPFLYIYTVTEPSQEVFETVDSWEHEAWYNFSIFVTSLRTLSNSSCLLWHKELLDVIMQPNWMTWCYKQLHEAVSFQVAVPVLGATWPLVPLHTWELCIGATMRVPTERAVRTTSGTRAIGSPPLI